MTTIAYKDGIIACDSRLTWGTTIIDDNWSKKIERKGRLFFLSGIPEDFEDFFELYFSGRQTHHRYLNVCGLLVENNFLYEVYVCDKGNRLYKLKLFLDRTTAYGSGGDFAFTAMDMGGTAKEAIKMAIKRNTSTGGRIRTYKLPFYSQGKRQLPKIKTPAKKGKVSKAAIKKAVESVMAKRK